MLVVNGSPDLFIFGEGKLSQPLWHGLTPVLEPVS